MYNRVADTFTDSLKKLRSTSKDTEAEKLIGLFTRVYEQANKKFPSDTEIPAIDPDDFIRQYTYIVDEREKLMSGLYNKGISKLFN